MMWTVPGLLGMTLLAAFGSYFLKLAAGKIGSGDLECAECAPAQERRGLALLKRALFCPSLYLGGGLYVGSAVLNYLLLKALPYSLVVPVGSLCYVWAVLIAHFLLHENVGRLKVLGLCLVVIGVVGVSLG